MKKILLSLFSVAMVFTCLHAQTITEFHYDNAGADVDEFVEVIIPADGCSYSLEFYNGSNGTEYNTVAVPACTSPTMDICGSGSAGCIIAIPVTGIQNGGSDGFALVQDCGGTITVIEFLSYEGTLTPVEGAASGMLSTDVGASETSNTPVGSSITVTNGVGEVTPIATPGDCPDAPLSVSLSNFAVTSVAGSVLLEWSTENEINNNFFSIQHSVDGRNFSELITVEGAGTTSTKSVYNYAHKDVVSGVNYYRLEQVDFDGRSSFTEIKSITIKSSNAVTVLPTLVAQDLNIRLAENLTIDTPINVFDITGQLVLESVINKDNNSQQIDAAELTSGTYFLILNVDGEIHSTKFMKL